MVPKCACGARRVFECQLLPTLINYLCVPASCTRADVTQDSIEDLDWDAVLVYSCPDGCDASSEEFVFVR